MSRKFFQANLKKTVLSAFLTERERWRKFGKIVTGQKCFTPVLYLDEKEHYITDGFLAIVFPL